MGRSDARSKVYSISKFRKKKHKAYLKEWGFEKALPKLEKIPAFWYFFDRDYIVYRIFSREFDIPQHCIEMVEKEYFFFLDYFKFRIPPYEKEITSMEALSRHRSLVKSINIICKEESPLYSHFATFIDAHQCKENSTKILEDMVDAGIHAVMSCSSFDSYIYGCYGDSINDIDKYGVSIIRTEFGIVRRKPTSKKLKIRGKQRNCYELLMNSGMHDFYTQNITWEGIEYPVYIMAHALQRVEERLCLDIDRRGNYRIMRMHVLYEELFLYRDKILLPVIHNPSNEKKEIIGYCVADIADSPHAVIKTFLFVSQSGTPEGDRLSEHLAIDKREKAFLEMENYDHFTKSDLREDETIVEICRECGLDHLFGLEEDMTVLMRGSASFIKETLQLENAKEANCVT